MRIKEANGFSVYLTVDGEKVEEHRVRRTGDVGGSVRTECYISPVRNTVFSINAHLGRQKPWKGDWIAEARVDGQPTHALHVRKRWHVTHRMDTYFKENVEGDTEECQFEFADIPSPTYPEATAGSRLHDEIPGTIVISVSRGEIDRVKPTRKRISHRFREMESGGRSTRAGKAVKRDSTMACGEEFIYDEADREEPFLRFVFKVRKQAYLVSKGLLDRLPAEQHPSQVSRSVRAKAEPDAETDQRVSTSSYQYEYPRRGIKRSLSEDEEEPDHVAQDQPAKRLRDAEAEIQRLKRMVEALIGRSPAGDVLQRSSSILDLS
ncbi:hypothetical protein IAU60_000862 [Kwoniella sp. DSM 27419]